jgi:hypothetical protein
MSISIFGVKLAPFVLHNLILRSTLMCFFAWDHVNRSHAGTTDSGDFGLTVQQIPFVELIPRNSPSSRER